MRSSLHPSGRKQKSNISIAVSGRGGKQKRDDVQVTTEAVLDDLRKDSKFFDESIVRHIPTFDPKEVEIGEELGRGEYGIVYEVSKLSLDDSIQFCVSPLGASCRSRVKSVPTVDILPEFVAIVEPGPPSHGRTQSVTFAEDTKVVHTTTDPSPPLISTAVNNNDTVGIDSGETVGTLGSVSAYNGGSCCALNDDCEDEVGEGDDNNEELIHGNEELALLAKYNTRTSMAANTHRDGMARYAIKRLIKDDTDEKKSSKKYIINKDAAIDLACEAMFLQSISHTNIIHLRGIVGVPGTPDFAILLDRLTVTLDEKIDNEWKPLEKKYNKGKFFGIMGRQRKDDKKKALMIRLLAAFDIARALRHLHQHKILFRDLKPQNVGFNVRGDVEIFDFGLAKELKAIDLIEEPDNYEATGLTGSRRFMAPEVVKCMNYGFKADVYSYTILLWQICCMKTPFPNMDADKHFETVIVQKKRPKQLNFIPIQLQVIMQDGWDDEPSKRPSFSQICQIMQVIISDGMEMTEADVCNRSTHLLNRSLRSHYKKDFHP